MLEKPEELFVGYVAQKAIIEHEGKILFVKSISPNAKWDLPGGRIHINEEPEAGLLRELQEELGMQCSVGKIVAVQRFTQDKNPTPFYFVGFAVSVVDDVANIAIPDDELSAFTWLGADEINAEVTYENCVLAVGKYYEAMA